MEIARILYMSSVGSDNVTVVFWAARDSDTSSDVLVAEIIVSLSRARLRDVTRVDMIMAVRARRGVKVIIRRTELGAEETKA